MFVNDKVGLTDRHRNETKKWGEEVVWSEVLGRGGSGDRERQGQRKAKSIQAGPYLLPRSRSSAGPSKSIDSKGVAVEMATGIVCCIVRHKAQLSRG